MWEHEGTCGCVREPVGDDGLIRAVRYRTRDGAEHMAQGRIFVLAAHAIESARLLLMSACERAPDGVANSSDQVGRNLMDHLQGAASARTPFPVYPFRGPPTTSGIDALRDGAFRREHAAFRMSLGNDGWGRSCGTPVSELVKLVMESRLFWSCAS